MLRRSNKIISVFIILICVNLIPLIFNFNSFHLITNSVFLISFTNIWNLIGKTIYYVYNFYVIQVIYYYIIDDNTNCFYKALNDFKKI